MSEHGKKENGEHPKEKEHPTWEALADKIAVQFDLWLEELQSYRRHSPGMGQQALDKIESLEKHLKEERRRALGEQRARNEEPGFWAEMESRLGKAVGDLREGLSKILDSSEEENKPDKRKDD